MVPDSESESESQQEAELRAEVLLLRREAAERQKEMEDMKKLLDRLAYQAAVADDVKVRALVVSHYM